VTLHAVTLLPTIALGFSHVAWGVRPAEVRKMAHIPGEKGSAATMKMSLLRAHRGQGGRLARGQGRPGHPPSTECLSCGRRFTSYERIDEIPYMSSRGRTREPFDRNKVLGDCARRARSVPSLPPPWSRWPTRSSRAPGDPGAGDRHGEGRGEGHRAAPRARQGRVRPLRQRLRQFEDVDQFMKVLNDLLEQRK